MSCTILCHPAVVLCLANAVRWMNEAYAPVSITPGFPNKYFAVCCRLPSGLHSTTLSRHVLGNLVEISLCTLSPICMSCFTLGSFIKQENFGTSVLLSTLMNQMVTPYILNLTGSSGTEIR